MSDSLREYWREQQRKRRLGKGCISCGNKAQAGSTRCAGCKERRREKRRAKARQGKS